MSKSSRSAILLSTTTAVCCLGVISPIAWLFNSNNYDLVLAWSMAATSCAITTLSIVWVRYWRAQTNLANNLKYMVSCYFKCLHKNKILIISIVSFVMLAS